MFFENVPGSKVSRRSYHNLANTILLDLCKRLEIAPYDGDIDLHEGYLKYNVSGIGEYVFCKQPPAMQIWASSPLTGPAKFRIDEENSKWTDIKNSTSFDTYIEEELRRIRNKLGDLKK